jgi:hypothetical protein
MILRYLHLINILNSYLSSRSKVIFLEIVLAPSVLT